MRWLEKKRETVLAEWRANKISFNDAVCALVDLGFTIEKANRVVSST